MSTLDESILKSRYCFKAAVVSKIMRWILETERAASKEGTIKGE
jgi:hypothetical protein